RVPVAQALKRRVKAHDLGQDVVGEAEQDSPEEQRRGSLTVLRKKPLESSYAARRCLCVVVDCGTTGLGADARGRAEAVGIAPHVRRLCPFLRPAETNLPRRRERETMADGGRTHPTGLRTRPLWRRGTTQLRASREGRPHGRDPWPSCECPVAPYPARARHGEGPPAEVGS